MKSNKNVLLVWDRMGDYHRARWSALQKELPDANVYAADLGSSDTLYGWENTSENPNYFKLSGKRPEQIDFLRIARFVSILRNFRIGTICISGYGKIEYLVFLIYGRLSGRKVIMFAESWYPGNYILDKVKSLFLRSVVHGFMVSGSRALQHFKERLNVGPARIRVGYSVVDNEHFKKNDRATSQQRILCVARFSPEKNLHSLIEAFFESRLYQKGWELLIVGGGPLKRSLQDLCADRSQIKLIEWRAYNELPDLYNSADVFVLPSTFEPWGLVVNEAMSAGLPLILSDEVGCLPDLLVSGENGWRFKPGTQNLTAAFNMVADSSVATLSRMGTASRRMISDYSLETFCRNLRELMQ